MSGVSSGSSSWDLQKYARFVNDNASHVHPNDAWKFYDNSTGQLALLLTSSHHLVICQGQCILENVSLWNAGSWMKGTSKGDSMLIMYKMQVHQVQSDKEKNHKFRVKFSGQTGEDCIETCSSCILRLASFFPIKRMNMLGQEEVVSAAKSSGDGDGKDDLTGDVAVGKLAEVLLKQGVQGLPAAYREASSHLPLLPSMLTLCLTDTNFPAFVGQVERELDKMKK